jgi:hypothetical protein
MLQRYVAIEAERSRLQGLLGRPAAGELRVRMSVSATLLLQLLFNVF